MVRIRQLFDKVQHRLLFVPLICIAISVLLAQGLLQLDSGLEDEQLPVVLRTTVDGARAILSALATGLIASVTLLLSIMLLAVQLASSQFSPRTVRDWIGDSVQQRAIGVVLGTVVYCLLVLRQTRTFGEGDALIPHLSVVVAVVLGIVSLIAMVRAVDHLTNRLRIESVAVGIMDQTVTMIEINEQLSAAEDPEMIPAPQPARGSLEMEPPSGAMPVVSLRSGWVQQIDSDGLMAAAPQDSTIYVPNAVGSFVFPDAPIAWVSPRPDDEEVCATAVQGCIAIGEGRTMQQDIQFGILQMVDIALRALSPGVNDPNTANDMIVHLGVVMLKLWERPSAHTVEERDGRTLVRQGVDHGDYLHAAFDPIRIYGAQDPQVSATMVRTLVSLCVEARRRDLPGPTKPIFEVIDQVVAATNESDLPEFDKERVRKLSSVPDQI